ncbi:MAG: RluA family pseudouridine synthase [Lentisphaeria bacterium]|nr:RluA family pseudouridine synthase [Lentisphaeria bacterium]
MSTGDMTSEELDLEEANESTEDLSEQFAVPAEYVGARIDLCLAQLYPHHSRAYLQRLIRKGAILVDDVPVRPAATLSPESAIRITWPQVKAYELHPEPVDFEILAEDEHVIVLNKPPGLCVHPAPGNRTGTLVHGLLDYDPDSFTPMIDAHMRPGIVHRLDMFTSGAMVVAKTPEALLRLKSAFKERRVEKTYLALVIGEFGSMTGTIENQIGRHSWHRTKMVVVQEGGKHALTKYRVLGTGEGFSLLEVRIFTGRTHQIRVHFSHLNHPILGDPVYGGSRSDCPVEVTRHLLHAWKLVFPHPDTGVMRQYMAPPPKDFRDVLEALGLPRIGEWA